jgi:hypothetical protein
MSAFKECVPECHDLFSNGFEESGALLGRRKTKPVKSGVCSAERGIRIGLGGISEGGFQRCASGWIHAAKGGSVCGNFEACNEMVSGDGHG